MKNIFYTMLVGGASLFLAASCMEIDNFDAPEEHLTGNIIDATTGQNILADQGEYHVRIWEQSFKLNPNAQDIPVKMNGEYNNTKLFKGTYDIVPEGAWWPVDTLKNVALKGTVRQDFKVTPYFLIKDFKAELDGDTIRMEGRIGAHHIPAYNEERGDEMPNAYDLRCFISMNQYCGAANNLGAYTNLEKVVNGKKVKVTQVNLRKPWRNLTDGEEDENGISYSKDVYKFAVKAKPGYTFFVRMGVNADDKFKHYNYSEIIKIEVPEK